MWWKDLREAPLADFGAFGDTDTPGSLRADDLRAIHNPKWREKVYRTFRNTPYDFNVYVYNAPEGIAPVGRGYGFVGDPIKVNDLKNIGKYVGIQPLSVIRQLIGKDPPNAEDSITVVLVENEGADRVALTPWILAHRVVHAMLYSAQSDPVRGMQPGQNLQISVHVQNIFKLFSTMFNDIEKSFDQSAHHKHKFMNLEGTSERINEFAKLIATFRSGRMGKLSNPGEFIVESITQYLVIGKVTFQRPILDDEHRTPPLDPTIDTELLAMAREKFTDKDRFVTTALQQKYRIKNPPRKPDLNRESYTAFNQQGQAVAAFGPDRVEKYRDQGYRIQRSPPPTPQAIARYNRFAKRVSELENLYDTWQADGMLQPPRQTNTDRLDQRLDRYEQQFNDEIAALLKSCVGKALVL